MYTSDEFQKAIRAYINETKSNGTDDFSRLRKEGQFFSDVRSKDDVESQIKNFTMIISEMERDSFASRYVIQSFLMDFCKYLEKDFLFNLTDHKTFLNMKNTLKRFTEEIQENDKSFRENLGLNSLDHLLEDYGILLKHSTIKSGGKRKSGKSIKTPAKRTSSKKALENEPSTLNSLWNNDGKLW